ncbi:MAG: hypothetical protein WBA13_10965 [Microcoleaceae cyanobacterium]
MKSQQQSFKQNNLYNEDSLSFNSSISAWKVTRFLLYIVGSLVILSILSNVAIYLLPDFPIRDAVARKFLLHEEQTFPTLYSSIALFLGSVLFWIIAQHKSQLKDKYTLSWKALSGIFTYLALDELLSIHENFSRPMHKLGVNGILHNAWVVPGMIGIAIFCVIFYQFFQHLPRYMKRLLLLSFAIFLGGAILVEIVGGYYKYLYGEANLGYSLITTIEESMEMLGVVMLIHALLVYINQLGINSVNINLNMGQSKNIKSGLN